MKTLLASTLVALAPLLTLGTDRFACDAKALSSAERARHEELSRALFSAVQEHRELPDGYGFRLPPEKLVATAEWVTLERRCCPFFTFVLEQTRDQGPVWLRVTGTKGVKEFIKEEFGV